KLCSALALLMLLTPALFADDKKPQMQMSPEEKAAMEAMQKAMTPGPQHKLLDNMVGTWTATTSMWMQPGAPPTVSKGTSVNKWIMGGRYMEQKFTGNFMNMPFNGLGYTGYDNVKKQYWGTWMDSMSTGTMMTTGGTDDNGMNWKFTGTVADPMTGKDTTLEEHITVKDKDHHTFEMWSPGPDGKMFKMMEITYTRKKA
ncbi:MAG: DUF1579 domain-containing protein, partial [Thermoanaerobaculia bacterium]